MSIKSKSSSREKVDSLKAKYIGLLSILNNKQWEHAFLSQELDAHRERVFQELAEKVAILKSKRLKIEDTRNELYLVRKDFEKLLGIEATKNIIKNLEKSLNDMNQCNSMFMLLLTELTATLGSLELAKNYIRKRVE